MASMRDIKAKIKSLKGTKRITSAMKAVSAAKLRKSQEKLIKDRPYSDVIREIVSNLYIRANTVDHPLLRRRKIIRSEIMVISSDKGLCGAFNANVIRTARKLSDDLKSKGIEINVETIGNRASNFFMRYSGLHVRKQIRDVFRKVGPNLGEEIASDILESYKAEYFDEIYVIYNRFINALKQKTVVEKLLPLPDGEFEPKGEYLISPDPSIVETAVKVYIKKRILRILRESETSEHAARMTAMDNATRNSSDLIKKLTLSFNKARQASITKELIEITTAIEAMR
ncbi:MAG: ATP synthase F1 subunit gamma [Nitrospiraceae bacterium]|nr:ATP synthase F1 subunit gamma [Nitrospiraceae bacterium]